MRESRAADAAKRVPIDQLLEARRRRVALPVEERWLDQCTEEQTANGDETDECAARQQADSRCLRRVAQRPEGDEGPDDEVAVGHADLEATLPRLQTLTVECCIRNELFGEPAVGDDGFDLVTCEILFAPPLEVCTGLPDVGGARELHGEGALLAHVPEPFLSVCDVLCGIKEFWPGDLHVDVIIPAHLCCLSWTIGLRVALQRVEVGVLRWVIPLLLRQCRQQLVQSLFVDNRRGESLEVGQWLRLRLLRHVDVGRAPGHAALRAPCKSTGRCHHSTEAHAETDQALCTQRILQCDSGAVQHTLRSLVVQSLVPLPVGNREGLGIRAEDVVGCTNC
mmetsp:Transcript_22134/g.55391  ORF Transcript_22134/g.55391 Transcript_22134/m.55391 type:complete len:337 (+) Transcript_22134:95-1105(+)